MNNRFTGLAAALIIGISAAACERSGPKGSQRVFVMVPKGVHPYYEPCFEGFRDAAARYGVKAEYMAPLTFELSQQVKTIENLIARGVDGIAISAVDNEGLVSVIDEATRAGIKVITFDAPAPAARALTYIGTANEESGYAGGKAMAEAMGKKGKLAVLQGGLAATNLNDRFKGFQRAIKELAPGIEIVTRENTDGDMSMTVNKTESLIQAYPDLKGIFGVSAECCPGAGAVIKERGKTGTIVIAGFDDLKKTLELIREGVVTFCVTQMTYKMGWLSLEKLIDAVEGKPLPKVIDTGVIIVTKENIDTYQQDMRKRLGAPRK